MRTLRSLRVYRRLLQLLPAPFRAMHAEEMELLFLEALAEARASGALTVWLVWLHAFLDVAWLVIRRGAREVGDLFYPGPTADGRQYGRPTIRAWLGDFTQDARYALRGLAKAKAFTTIAVLSLTVGIGVNAAIYSVVHTTMFRPVPGVTGADRIVEILNVSDGREFQEWTYPDLLDVRTAETPLEEFAGWKARVGSFGTGDGARPIEVTYVSANYFRVLGVTLSHGRGFLPGEDVVPGGHDVAVVSHRMWQTDLEGDRDVIGRTITINRKAYTVVGVAPDVFRGSRPLNVAPEVWLPLTDHPLMLEAHSAADDRELHWVLTLGRLREGATVDEANAALRTVFARLAAAYPETNEHRGARAAAFGTFPALHRAADMIVAGAIVGLVGVVLLIICGNLAGMVLARSATRERELAVRLALGSGRGRLLRQLMTEAVVIAVAGGTAGVLLAHWATSFASSAGWAPPLGYHVNGPVLAYSLTVTLGTTVVFGFFPALRFSRPEMVSSLKDDTGGGARRVSRVHRLAAAGQTGIALLLIVVCSLFLRAVGVMDQRDLGFDPDNLFIAHVDLTAQGYDDARTGLTFVDRVRESVDAIAGVSNVAVSDGIPLDLIGNFTSASRPDPSDGEGEKVAVEFTRATEGFFEGVGTPILQGRGFREADKVSTARVVVITKALADRLWPGESAVGRQVRVPLAQDDPMHTVVGVVPDVASSTATRDIPHVFVALRQHYRPRLMIVIRGRGDGGQLGTSIREAVLAIDPELPPATLISSRSLVRQSTSGQRATAGGAAALGVLALILSGIGVYGVVAFAVANRTREIGLRMAMGATQGQVLRGVLWDAIRLATPGLVVGAILAGGTAVVMQSELLGLSPVDPVSFSFALGLLLVLVLVASLIPARRASGVDPMVALRSE